MKGAIKGKREAQYSDSIATYNENGGGKYCRKESKKRDIAFCLLGIVALLLCMSGLAYYKSNYEEILITDFKWERIIEIEKYQTDEWLPERTLISTGDDQVPYWEEFELQWGEKIATRKQKYYIVGSDKQGHEKTVELYYGKWQELEIGQRVRLKVSSLGVGGIIKSE